MIQNIFQKFHIVHFIKNSSWQSYQIIFYLILVFLIFVCINFLYLGHNQSKQVSSTSWSSNFLNIILTLLNTVLFIPILGLFLGVFSCVPSKLDSNVSIHLYFNNLECWQGTHLIHIFFGAFGALLLISLCCLLNLTYFETRSRSKNSLARYSKNFFYEK